MTAEEVVEAIENIIPYSLSEEHRALMLGVVSGFAAQQVAYCETNELNVMLKQAWEKVAQARRETWEEAARESIGACSVISHWGKDDHIQAGCVTEQIAEEFRRRAHQEEPHES